MKLERTKNAKRILFFGVIQKLTSIILPFISRTVLIYTLGTQYLGLNSLFSSILSVLSVTELGFGMALVYNMYKPIAEDDPLKICALLNFYKKCYRYIGSIIFVVGLLLMPFLRYVIKDEIPSNTNIYIIYVISLCSTCVTYFMFAYKSALLMAFQRNDIIYKISMIIITIQYTTQIYVLLIFKNYYIFLGLTFFYVIVNNVWVAIKVSKMFPEYKTIGKLETTDYKEIFLKMRGLVAYKIGNIVTNSVDNIVISAFFGLSMVAIYGNYFYIISTLFSFLSLYHSSIYAGLGNRIVCEPVEKNYILFNNLFLVQSWMIGWMSTCLICLYQPFIEVWLGREFLVPFGVVICLAIYFYFLKINDVVYMFKEAAGMWNLDKWRPLTSSAFNLGLNLILVNYIGIYGVIISTIASEIFFNIIWSSMVLFRNYFLVSIMEYYKNILMQLFVTVIIASLTYIVCNLIVITGVLQVFIRAFVCCTVPNLLFLLVFHISNKKKNIYEMMNKLVKN